MKQFKMNHRGDCSDHRLFSPCYFRTYDTVGNELSDGNFVTFLKVSIADGGAAGVIPGEQAKQGETSSGMTASTVMRAILN